MRETANKHIEDLPSGWCASTLGEIRLDHSESITPSKLSNKRFILYSVPSFDDGIPENILGKNIGSNKITATEDTVLLCKINPRINRVWLVGPHGKHPVIASTEWIPFSPVDGIAPKYLLYFLQNPAFRNFISLNVSGVGGSLMRTKPAMISNYPFPIAPFNECSASVAN